MNINEKVHITSIIASLDKIYKQSKLNGELNSEDIYILDSIYKLINDCETSLNDFQIKTLTTLYNSIRKSSKFICPVDKYKSYTTTSNNKFIQAEVDDCNTLPIQDLIYYWQEELGVTDSEILTKIAQGDYLDTKFSDLKPEFINGKNINYNDIGVICFALNKTLSGDNYFIYDDDNNADVTGAFKSFYNSILKTRIFISYNIYSHGLMNFKIKKI